VTEPPAVAYADASALVKLIIVEPEGPDLSARLGRHRRILTSVVGAVEVVRVGRRTRGAEGVQDAEDLLASLTIVPVTDEVRRRAGELGPPGMRSLDAIHLASAEQLGSDLRGFVTYDERLASAAEGRGLRVFRPA
jgi:predicted nucleic acid-binding protein